MDSCSWNPETTGDQESESSSTGGIVVVVGPEYCAPYPVGMVISAQKKSLRGLKCRYDVRDSNDNLMFEIKNEVFHIGNRKLVKDAAGNPILTLRQKGLSFHCAWEVFRGKSSDQKDLLFTTRWSSWTRFKGRLEVYLAGNANKEVCDFNVKEDNPGRPCTIFAGESNSHVVARMFATFKASFRIVSLTIDEKYAVSVYCNVDHAFIMAILVILRETNDE